MVELKQKRLRTLAPSPLQGPPSQDLQEEDWEQEDKDEDVGPRLEHSPSVQAGELERVKLPLWGGGKEKVLSSPSCLVSFLDSESPNPEEVPDYLL